MKNPNYKYQQALQTLIDINILREDAYFFSKIALLQPDKRVRYQQYVELFRVEEERSRIEGQLLRILDEMEINEYWKTSLFQFSNKIYKNIKNFHQKITTLSNKIAEISDTNAFLQILRNSCIEKLAQSKNLRQFVQPIIQRLRQRVLKQFAILNNFGINSKIIELAKKQQSLRNNRYLNIIKSKDSSLFHKFHQKSLLQLQIQCQRITNKQMRPKDEHPLSMMSQLLDLEENDDYQRSYQAQNGMNITLAYKDQGFCEFITTKYNRIVKDFLNRNGFNERSINKFREKYNENTNKAKRVVKSNTVYNDYFKKSQKRSQLCQQQQLQTSIQIKNITNLTKNHKQSTTINQQETAQPQKRGNIFKIQKLQNRNKPHTLRPLGQSKQNNKQVVHQKIIQMKLQEQPLQIAKILRIRRRKHIPIFREQNGWSLLVKQNQSKISFLIH